MITNGLILYLFMVNSHFIPTETSPLTKENLKVELVQVLFRHGARTAIGCESDLLHDTEASFYPWGFAQLTTEGMQQEYQIGRMLRERYDGFLPTLFNQKHVYAYSSGFARTKASLELVLSALYPPVNEYIWNSKLNWMPIPIHSNPKQLDILNKPRYCPKFINLLLDLYNSTELKQEISKHDEIRAMLKDVYGREFNFGYTFCAYNSLVVQKSLDLPLPDWYTDEKFKKLHDAASFYLNTLSYTKELKRANGGTYVRRFVENMNDTNSAKGRKIYLYASHDKSLHAIARFHNITLPRIPDYGSAIVVEKLRDQKNNRYVRLLFWSGSPKKLTVLRIDECAEICPMEQYLKIVTPMLPSDDDMLCLFRSINPENLGTILNSDTTAIDN
ncbi:hypothetical protein QAD02_000192 [Eretmocerus hayati]|uniref:Uncharacterized protein n=1 Tax=Eretmocerus hayati TaxID=131215 RepID=A0ACC2NCU9_9HYME|nr:hypothetical protein QAD02_000192 [Eretmocerus hayati]